MRVGLMGYGKAGKAVANVLANDPRYELAWVMRQTVANETHVDGSQAIPVVGMNQWSVNDWLDEQPVQAVVDFSGADNVFNYGESLRSRGIMLVSAISAYEDRHLSYLRELGRDTRVLSSPNITLGINFLLLAAQLLRSIAPFADVEVVEQHFREKPEVSGTARKLAEKLNLDDGRVTSLRIGGIVGHHEVIFGFPHQTVRLTHESIRREAFGTGAAFALQELAAQRNGFYTLDELLMQKIKSALRG